MGRVKDENFQYYGSSLKNSIFRGMGFTKNQYKGELAKKGAWIVFRFKLRAGGGASQIRGRCF